jgi:hypothetical protein
MEFIVEMEAKSSAKIGALIQAQKDDQKFAAESWKRADERWARTEEGIRALLAITEMRGKEIQANTEQILAQSQQIANLSETTKSTDDRLNALIYIVERQLSNGGNGQQ